MLKTKLDISGADTEIRALDQVGKGISERAMGGILFTAAKPMELRMKANAPVGPYVPTLKGSDYRRGGATRDDVRRKLVFDKPNEATVLVGVSKGYGKVGWRTHFTEYGTKSWRGRPFVERSGQASQAQVVRAFNNGIEKLVEDEKRKAGL